MSDIRNNYFVKYGKSEIPIPSDSLSNPVIIDTSDIQIKEISAYEFNELIRPQLIKYIGDKKKLLIIIPDKTRKSRIELLLPSLLKLIKNSGIQDKNITILFANGAHSPITKEEQLKILGADILQHYRVLNHNSKSDDAVFLGKTKRGTPVRVNPLIQEHDGIIAISSVTHHYFAGFSGGPKMLLPGITHEETIFSNHRLVIDEQGIFNKNCSDGILEGNPVYEDIAEAISFYPPAIYIGFILNEQDNILSVQCGDIIKTHKSLSELVHITYEKSIKRLYDLVIVSTGGYPHDITFIQTHKSIHHAFNAVKPNGVILCVAECSEGIGSESFLHWFEYNSSIEMVHGLKNNYTLNGHTALALKSKTEKCNIILFTSLNKELTNKIGLFHVSEMEEGLKLAKTLLPQYFRTLIIPKGAVTIINNI